VCLSLFRLNKIPSAQPPRSISILRPLWEWNSTFVTIVAFILQDIARTIVLVASLRVIWGVRNLSKPDTDESSNAYELKKRTQFLWRTLLSLVLLECVEMCVKFFEVETICNAPYVTQMREKRHPNMTAAELKNAQDKCMLISDLYDYVFELITIVLLIYLTYIVHSYGRSIKTTSTTDDKQQVVDGTEAVVIGQVVNADEADI
jgi:hypothetical protein